MTTTWKQRAAASGAVSLCCFAVCTGVASARPIASASQAPSLAAPPVVAPPPGVVIPPVQSPNSFPQGLGHTHHRHNY